MKREKLKVEWFTPFAGLEDLSPPVPASEMIPTWIKKMAAHHDRGDVQSGSYHTLGPKGTHHDAGTFKTCPGWADLYKEAYILQMWADCIIKSSPKGAQATFSSASFGSDVHPNFQGLDHAPTDDYTITLKLIAPWHLRTPPGWGVLQLPLQWEFNPNFDVAMGVIHSDIVHEINPQLMLRNPEFTLKFGTPIAMYLPIKLDKSLEKSSSIGYITPEQQHSFARGSLGAFLKFTQSYRMIIERLNRYV